MPSDYEQPVARLMHGLGNLERWLELACRRMLTRCAYNYGRPLDELGKGSQQRQGCMWRADHVLPRASSRRRGSKRK